LSNSSHCFTNFLIPLRRVARYWIIINPIVNL
jgi:hypothetical protein